MAKRGLYANIRAKKKRIAAGSGEKIPTMEGGRIERVIFENGQK